MNKPGLFNPGGGGAARAVPAPMDLTRGGPYFAGMLLIALVAFWPSYLSRLSTNSAYTHVHAVLATLWILLLITQPTLIRRRRRDLHRMLGQASYALAPLLVISIILLAHSRISPLQGDALLRQTYLLYPQLSTALLFGGLYAMAVYYRRTPPLHARFMICTAFTLIDPITIRIVVAMHLSLTWNPQWLTFGLADAAILALIWYDRGTHRGRWVLPAMLPVFVLVQLPGVLGVTETAWWREFARSFAALPLT